MIPVIITAALVGAELTKEQTPSLPVTPDEIAEAARLAVGAGAAVLHLHVRDKKGQPTCEAKIFQEVVKKIRKQTDAILQVSTGGAVGDSFEDRMKPLEAGAEMASLNSGSVNFGSEVFENPRPFIEKLAHRMKQHHIKPEIEVYDLSHLETALELVQQGLIPGPPHFQFVLGVKGGMLASEQNLRLLVERLGQFARGQFALPSDATWTVAGTGRHQFPMAELALKMGGHVRVGLEDNIYLEKGVLAKGSHELVEKAVALAKGFGRPVASIEEARKLLTLPPLCKGR